MNVTPDQKRLIEHVLNVVETGTPEGRYDDISIFHDGPHKMLQVTYGRSQMTEYGNLRELVKNYADAGGQFSASLRSYVDKIGRVPLVHDDTFKNLLRAAGQKDPVMRKAQDELFELRYWQPAHKWANNEGFVCPLSMLVIYDSYIHSGHILEFLRARFHEVPPSKGGEEKAWIAAYLRVRQDWLRNNSNPDLHATIYRTRCYIEQIARTNWDLSQRPIHVNGVDVS